MIYSNLLAVGDWIGWAIGAAVLLALIILIAIYVPLKTWFRAMVSGAYISIFRMIGIKMRKIDVQMIVNAYISAKKAGLSINVNELETHFMAGGNVNQVVAALIAAHNARIPLGVDTAKAIDLAGRDVLEAVRVSVTPKIISTPEIAAIAKDGIELRVVAKITVRANLDRLIGGAGEETIIARVGEGIVTAIGQSENHQDVLQNPSIISSILNHDDKLDKNTAYEILSVDIADVDVGKNIGAQLKIDKANADKQIAQAKAEERRAEAQASEQEMIAKTQEMKAQVLLAESEVPKAMADAFREGKLGVMDYYRMQNIVADTSMRSSFAGTTSKTALEAPKNTEGTGTRSNKKPDKKGE